MPKIKVRAAERTFSTESGQFHWIPGSLIALRIFAVRWEIFDLTNPNPKLIGSCQFKPFEGWDLSITTDWRCAKITVGLMRGNRLQQWVITRGDDSQSIFLELKRADLPVQLKWRGLKNDAEWTLHRKEGLMLSNHPQFIDMLDCRMRHRQRKVLQERLFFGCHKIAHWPRIDKRCDLTELGPIFYLAGQWARALLPPMTNEQSLMADKAARDSGLYSNDKNLLGAFADFWRSHFSQVAFPHWNQVENSGFEPIWQADLSPLYLYIFIADWLLSRLLKTSADELIFLPSLPFVCHAGQALAMSCPLGNCDFKWSKKRLKEVIVRCSRSGSMTMIFQKKVDQVRVRRLDRRFGAIYTLDDQSALRLHLQSGRNYQIDQIANSY